MRKLRRDIAATLTALALAAAAAWGGQSPISEQLRREQAELAKLQAELATLRGEPAAAEPRPREAGASAADPQKRGAMAKGGAEKEAEAGVPRAPGSAQGQAPTPPSPLVRRPTLAAGDVLYRVGRYAEARAVYEAALVIALRRLTNESKNFCR